MDKSNKVEEKKIVNNNILKFIRQNLMIVYIKY